MSNIPTDLVQIDLDTAMALYLAGYSNIPIIVDNGYPGGWASMEPRHFEDLFDGIMFFASDSKRESLLNPPRTDIGKLAEEIALETAKPAPAPTESLADAFTDDTDETDDDPDWVEDEPQTPEEIPEEDEVPTVSKVTEETDSTVKDEILKAATAIELGEKKPWAWNVKDAIRYNEKYKVPLGKLAIIYDISQPTLRKRIKEYKAKS